MEEYSLRRNYKDYRVVVKRVKVSYKEMIKVSFVERRQYVEKKMLDVGFDMSKRVSKFEDLEKLITVYEQKKYIIPKVKKI